MKKPRMSQESTSYLQKRHLNDLKKKNKKSFYYALLKYQESPNSFLCLLRGPAWYSQLGSSPEKLYIKVRGRVFSMITVINYLNNLAP